MKRLLLTLIVLVYGFNQVAAQRFPVTVTAQVNPPAPVNFHNYADGTTINSPLRVQLLLNDLTVSNEQIRLKVSFEGNGIAFESRDVVVGASQLFIDGGVPLVLTNVELAPYFEFQNIQGINPNIYSRTIPEGSYQFCFEVFDFTTGNRFSSKTCATTYIFKNEPPILNLPFNKVNIEPKEVDNIVFQWTPRHINVSNVEYELSIVEIWDDFVDPQTAFLSAVPFFETTTKTTSFVYGPAQPLLLPDKRYAWRVKAKALQGAEEIGLFRNEGNSEIFWFSRTSPCTTPLNVYAEPKGISKINVFWDEDPTVYQEYTIAYREANKQNAQWFTMRTNSGWATIWDLKPGTTYEYKVKGKCKYQYGQYSEIQEITTAKAQDETANYNCGIVPDEIAISNRNPHPGLSIGDRITAGDFVITITEIEAQANGILTGRGYVGIPYLKLARFGVKFNGILVNTDNQLAQGEIVTLYDPEFGEGEDMTIDVDIDISDGITGDQGELDSRVDVDYVITSITINSNGAIVVTDENGEEEIFPGGRDVQIRDSSGAIWSVGDDGTVIKEQEAEGGAATDDNTTGISDGEISEISAIGVRVDFQESGVYYFDSLPKGSGLEELRKEYEILTMANGDEYYVPFKAISDIKGEDFIEAKATFSDNSITTSDIVFKTKKGIKIPASWNGNIATLSLRKKSGYLIEKVLATVKPKDSNDDKYDIAGALNLVHLGSDKTKDINVVIVPVNNARITDNIKGKINDIYNKAGINFNIKVESRLQIPENVWDIEKNDNILNAGESGLLSHYSAEEIAINEYFKTNRNYKKDAYYLFLTDFRAINSKTNREIAGFMPLKRQFGFVFKKSSNDAITAAHELAHGVFGLEHPHKTYKFSEGSTNFLMDYGDDAVLNHMDWKNMHAPGFRLYWFQDDEEGEYDKQEFADKVFQIIRCAYINSETILSANVFGKMGDHSASNVEEYGTITINIENKPVNIGRADVEDYWINNGEKDPRYYSLDFGGVVIRALKQYQYNKGKLDKLQDHLFPKDRSQYIEKTKEIVDQLINKDKFDNEDLEKLRSIANCGAQYFTAQQRFSVISKILESTNITERFEDLILDLFEITPISEDIGLYYSEFYKELLDNPRVFDELLADIDDTSVTNFWKGKEDNYTRFIKALGNTTSKINSDLQKWDVINYLVSKYHDDLKENHQIALNAIFSSIKDYQALANEIPQITKLFVEMLLEETENLDGYKIIFDIAVERNKNKEVFAHFTQAEYRKIQEVNRYTETNKLSWVVPFKLYYRVGTGAGRYISPYEFYHWAKLLTDKYGQQDILDYNRRKLINEQLTKENSEAFFDEFLRGYKDFLTKFDNTRLAFWNNIKTIDCDNKRTIIEHINANENTASLRKVNTDKRINLLVKMFECNWFTVSNDNELQNGSDALIKLVTSFDPKKQYVLTEIEKKIGLKTIYDKLYGKRLSIFLAWMGSQVTESKYEIDLANVENQISQVFKKDGTLRSPDDLLKLESDLFKWDNFGIDKITNSTIQTEELGELRYNQMVLVYVSGSFEFLGKKFKKGDVLVMPLVQAFAMSNSNRNTAYGKAGLLAVDVVTIAVGVGGLKILFTAGNAVRKSFVITDLLGSTASALATALNEDAISQDTRFKLQMLSIVVSLPNLARLNKKFDNYIISVDESINTARINETSRKVLNNHLSEITNKLGTDELVFVTKLKSESNILLRENYNKLTEELKALFRSDFKNATDDVLKELNQITKFKQFDQFKEIWFANRNEELLAALSDVNKFKAWWYPKIRVPDNFFANKREFERTINDYDKISSSIRGEAYNYYKQRKWDKLEALFKEHKINDGWPPASGGFNTETLPLTKGMKFDRYGGAIKIEDNVPLLGGTFTSPMKSNGQPYEFPKRALNLSKAQYDFYYEIELLKNLPFNGELADVIPWFGLEGLGKQMLFKIPKGSTGYTKTFNELVDEGYLKVTIKESPSGKYSNLVGTVLAPKTSNWLDDLSLVTRSELEDFYKTIKDDPPVKLEPNTPAHKAQRWEQYKLSKGDDAWDFERWSKTYDQNMTRATIANAKVDEYHKTLNWGDREVTIDIGDQRRRLDIADKELEKGIEYKEYSSGKVYASEDIRKEVAFDKLLVQEDWEMEWVFKACEPSGPLKELLNQAGIKIKLIK